MADRLQSTSGLLSAVYRCADVEADFEIMPGQSADPGFFSLDNGTPCYGRLSGAQPALAAGGTLPQMSLEMRDRRIGLRFDPVEVIDGLRLERYVDRSEGNQGLMRRLYYSIRPLLPVAVRKYLQRASLRGWDQIPFPQWPVDRSADRVHEWLLMLAMRAQGVSEIPFVWFWPDGCSSSVIMTHDVETSTGRDFCPTLMAINNSYEIKSSFQVVPEERYTVPADFLDSIRAQGFEVNIHDLNHDGQLFYLGYKQFRDRVERINRYGKAFGARGFRSAVLYRNPAWLKDLDFAYDMSIPNVAHLDPQRGGCCTLMPYFIDDLLEIPVTATQDYSLFHILNDYSTTLWEQQLELIREAHGMASFIIHPDYIIETRARRTYEKLLHLLATARTIKNVWIARPGEMCDWWRARSKMRLVHTGRGWAVEGEGSDRARIAYAFLDDRRIGYQVESHTTSNAVTVMN